MTALEYGVERRRSDGTTFVAAGFTLAGARQAVERSGDPKLFDPAATRVLVRACADWRTEELNEGEAE